MLRYLPNALTLSRLILALPLGMLILRQDYEMALGVGLLAGLTDALDGFVARRLQAFSRFGAALDPVSDKVLITVSFLCFASVGLIPWYVAAVVITRDLVIVAGAICYHWLIGPFDFAATSLSKINMLIQICFCVLVLTAQVVPGIGKPVVDLASLMVVIIAIASGMHYVIAWSNKAVRNRGKGVQD